jgi:ketosteroid isomerase-like protein
MRSLTPALLRSLLCVALVAASCRSSGTAPDDESFRTLLRGYESGLKPGAIRVARDDAEWRELWKEHTSTILPRPDAPAIDWQHDMVVCVALGARPTGGYGVRITNVVRENGRVVVEAEETKPAHDAIVPQVVSHPYCIATTPRADGEVELRMR